MNKRSTPFAALRAAAQRLWSGKRFDLQHTIFVSLAAHLLLTINIEFERTPPPAQEMEVEFQAVKLDKAVPPPPPPPTPTTIVEAPKEPPKELLEADPVPIEDAVVINEPAPSEQEEELGEEVLPQVVDVPSPPAPDEEPDDGEEEVRNAGLIALDNFSNELAKHIAKFKKYPKVAQRRGWQGEVVLEVQLSGEGTLIASRVRVSSGFKPLDDEGEKMIARAVPFPVPPEILRARSFTILVPVKFTLY